MIAYFPLVYPDELLYGWIARAYVKSGYPAYSYFAEEFFKRKMVTPDIEFLNEYTPAALSMLTKDITMDEVIKKHTMFPYYARFCTKDERLNAYEAALKTQIISYQIPKFRKHNGYFVKYCPICAKNDRQKHGEAYYHRIHQIDGIEICTVHKCKLLQTDVVIGKTTPKLFDAESNIPLSSEVISLENALEGQIADYVIAVFQADLDMDGDVAYGEYLHYKLAGTKYCSARGLVRNISLLLNDYLEYYKGYESNPIQRVSQMQQLFKNKRRNPLDICLLAYFLDISVDEIIKMRLPDISPTEWFDSEVTKLHEQGLKYPEIAKRLGGSYYNVKAIGEGRVDKLKNKTYIRRSTGGKVSRDWLQFDKDMLPEVKKAVYEIENQQESLPQNVSVAGIERELELTNGSLKKMPLCKAYIESHRLAQAELWAKKVVWAAKKVIADGDSFNWKHIRNYTNMRSKNFQQCKPYLDRYANEELAQHIKEIL